jgi:hypothetical protein
MFLGPDPDKFEDAWLNLSLPEVDSEADMMVEMLLYVAPYWQRGAAWDAEFSADEEPISSCVPSRPPSLCEIAEML